MIKKQQNWLSLVQTRYHYAKLFNERISDNLYMIYIYILINVEDMAWTSCYIRYFMFYVDVICYQCTKTYDGFS